jgi:hypothetical protein
VRERATLGHSSKEGAGMKGFRSLLRLTAVSLACVTASLAIAAIPPVVDIPPAPQARTMIYALNTEMVVRDWVLCTSQESAEELVQAREESDERARSTFVRLREAKACGQFPELRVILKKPLYRSPEETGHAGRVFGALVHVSKNWASAFLVYCGLPETARSATRSGELPPDFRKGI